MQLMYFFDCDLVSIVLIPYTKPVKYIFKFSYTGYHYTTNDKSELAFFNIVMLLSFYVNVDSNFNPKTVCLE